MSTDNYDPNVAADHTGMAFQHLPGAERRDPLAIFRNPAVLDCHRCGSESWRVHVDNTPHSGLMCLQCLKCKGYSKPIEPHKPQADDHRMKALGLYVPNPNFQSKARQLEIEFDVEQE